VTDKKEIIHLFLKNGFQVSGTALPLILDNPDKILSGLKSLKPRPLIITEKHVERFSKKEPKPKNNLKILKTYKYLSGPVQIEDYVNFFFSRYKKIKNILLKRMKDEKNISINKISKQPSTFSIIGIIKNKTDNSLLLEDPSGDTNVFFEKAMKGELDKVDQDDVVGLKCKKIKEKIYGEKIILPDILSSREVNKTKKEIDLILVSDQGELNSKKIVKFIDKNCKSPLVFIFTSKDDKKIVGGISKFEPTIINSKFSPTLFDVNGLKILTLTKKFLTGSKIKESSNSISLSILKKRSLPLAQDIRKMGVGGFVLEEVPDIIISNFSENSKKNYKGTTIISISNPEKIFIINLKNRKALMKSL
jgi:hypothetical protein